MSLIAALIVFEAIMMGLGRELARQQAAKKQADLEQKRRELTKAYADGTIDDLQFGNAMDRLYEQGLKPAQETMKELP